MSDKPLKLGTKMREIPMNIPNKEFLGKILDDIHENLHKFVADEISLPEALLRVHIIIDNWLPEIQAIRDIEEVKRVN